MKEQILEALKKAEGDFCSGGELCRSFQVSRTAVWKAVNQLKKEGYEIEAVTNKGYRLLAVPDVVTREAILPLLKKDSMIKKIYSYTSIDSTNEEAKRIAVREENVHGSLVIAEEQVKGKGRRGRSWASPAGTSVYMTLILTPDIAPGNASMLTLIAALAVNRAVREVTGLESLIKWPNDVIVNGKKVCGILTEMSVDMDVIHYIVTGIGINTNQTEFPKELAPYGTSLLLESGRPIKRAELAAKTLEYFQEFYEIFIETEDLSRLYGVYNEVLVNIDKQVKLLYPGRETSGTAHGINERGELLVTDEDGQEKSVASGEVSVRGLYGYV